MAQLTNPNPRAYEVLPQYHQYPVDASQTIYEGSAVDTPKVTSGGATAGYMRQLVALDLFIGFSNDTVSNASGAAGAVNVDVITEGVVKLNVVGASISAIGLDVYASDGNTFTITQSGNEYITDSSVGKIVKWLSGTSCLVKFHGEGYGSVDFTNL
jgi:hypothetical protein